MDQPAKNNPDMFQSMKVADLLQEQFYKDRTVLPAQMVLRMATIDGPKALNLEKFVGSLEVGKKAGIILLDFRKPHLTLAHAPYVNIV